MCRSTPSAIYWDNKTFRTGYESWKTGADDKLTKHGTSINQNATAITEEVSARTTADGALSSSVATISAKADEISLTVASNTGEKLNLIPDSFQRSVVKADFAEVYTYKREHTF